MQSVPGPPKTRAVSPPQRRASLRSLLLGCLSPPLEPDRDRGNARQRAAQPLDDVPNLSDTSEASGNAGTLEEEGILVTCDVEAGIAPRDDESEAGADGKLVEPVASAVEDPSTQSHTSWSFMDDEIAYLLNDESPAAVTLMPGRPGHSWSPTHPGDTISRTEGTAGRHVSSISCPATCFPDNSASLLAGPQQQPAARSRPVSRASTLPTIEESTIQRQVSSSGSLHDGPDVSDPCNYFNLKGQTDDMFNAFCQPMHPPGKDTKSADGTSPANSSGDLGRHSSHDTSSQHLILGHPSFSRPPSSSLASQDQAWPAPYPSHALMQNLQQRIAGAVLGQQAAWQSARPPSAEGDSLSVPPHRNDHTFGGFNSFSSSRSSRSQSRPTTEPPSVKILGMDSSMAGARQRRQASPVIKAHSAPHPATSSVGFGATAFMQRSSEPQPVLARVRAHLLKAQHHQQPVISKLDWDNAQSLDVVNLTHKRWALSGDAAADDLMTQFGAASDPVAEARYSWPGMHHSRQVPALMPARVSLSASSQAGQSHRQHSSSSHAVGGSPKQQAEQAGN